MAARTPFRLIAEVCQRTGASVVLIGGQALGAHKPVDAASEAFKSTCLNFGTPELYRKILEYTQDEG